MQIETLQPYNDMLASLVLVLCLIKFLYLKYILENLKNNSTTISTIDGIFITSFDSWFTSPVGKRSGKVG